MGHYVHPDDPEWLETARGYLQDVGYAVVEAVLDTETIAAARSALENAKQGLIAELGEARWGRSLAAGYNELRLPMRYDPFFYRILEIEPMLALVDAVLSPRAILRFQHGMTTPSGDTPSLNQYRFHMNFRHTGDRPVALDVVFAISEFNEQTGTLAIVPGSRRPCPTWSTPVETSACRRGRCW